MKITINESELISVVKKVINELDTRSYSTLMNKTSDYGWTTYLNNEPNKHSNPSQKGNKQEKVNSLARERFLEQFYREFPLGTTKIKTNYGIYSFDGLNFRANHTMYDLAFKSDEKNSENSRFWARKTTKGFGIMFGDGIRITDANSMDLINDMFKYTN